MNFIAGLLLLAVGDEETAFWGLAHFCEDVNPMCYSPAMLGTRADLAALEELLEAELPALSQHCASMHLQLSLLAAGWLLIYFINVLPAPAALRVLEVAMLEGSDVTFAVTLALLRDVQEQLLDCYDLNEVRGVSCACRRVSVEDPWTRGMRASPDGVIEDAWGVLERGLRVQCSVRLNAFDRGLLTTHSVLHSYREQLLEVLKARQAGLYDIDPLLVEARGLLGRIRPFLRISRAWHLKYVLASILPTHFIATAKTSLRMRVTGAVGLSCPGAHAACALAVPPSNELRVQEGALAVGGGRAGALGHRRSRSLEARDDRRLRQVLYRSVFVGGWRKDWHMHIASHIGWTRSSGTCAWLTRRHARPHSRT
jgi:hypothetical protein